MIKDYLNKFCAGATTSAATGLVAHAAGAFKVGEAIDLGKATNYPGDGQRAMFAVVRVVTQIIHAGTAATIYFQIVSSAAEALTSPRVHLTSGSLLTDTAANINQAIDDAIGSGSVDLTAMPNQTPASATAARLATYLPALAAQLPPGPYLRYLGVLATVVTTTTTAGTIEAFLTPDIDRWTAKPDAI